MTENIKKSTQEKSRQRVSDHREVFTLPSIVSELRAEIHRRYRSRDAQVNLPRPNPISGFYHSAQGQESLMHTCEIR